MPCQVGCGVQSGSDSADLDSGTLGTMEPTTHTWILRCVMCAMDVLNNCVH